MKTKISDILFNIASDKLSKAVVHKYKEQKALNDKLRELNNSPSNPEGEQVESRKVNQL